MSSLAGALIPPESSSVYSTAQVSHENDISSDVDMKPEGSLHSEDPEAVEAEAEDEEMTDLFGADGEVEAAPTHDRGASPGDSAEESERLGSAEAEQRRALEYEEDDVPPEAAFEEREASVVFPNLPVPTSTDGENWVIRMPNFVKVDSKPFHPDTYVGPEHEEDDAAQQTENLREKSMSIKLKVENTVRWRWVKDEVGNDRRQSNSRIIRWSDGTLSLRLGKELFDITQSVDTSGAIARQSLGGSQASQSQSQPTVTPGKSHGLTYLVAQHKRSEVLQAEAVITGQMTLRPTGMQSETHRMLVRAVGQKHNKVARLRMAPDPAMDPEREKMELIKQSARKSKRKATVYNGSGGGRNKRQSRRRPETEWSDDEGFGAFAASDDEEELGMSTSRGTGKKKVRDEERGGEYQEDGFVVADESDDDADYGVSRSHRRRHEEEDPLDRLDAKIESRRKGRSFDDEDGEEGNADDGMDVESEEEEEQKVRRAGASGTRKRQALYEDDDDE